MDTAQQLPEIFAWIDEVATGERTADVRVLLGNNGQLSIRAGGPGVLSWPAGPPFEQYEVLLDHDPSRFWNRYSDEMGLTYSRVPRLLLTHHIMRHGGVREIEYEIEKRDPVGILKLQLMVPLSNQNAVMQAISNVSGVRLTSTDFVMG